MTRFFIIISFVCLMISGFFFQVHASDLYNPKKRYYAVFYMETRNGNCAYRIEYSQYFNNGKEAYHAKLPAGYKKYMAWCWKDGSGNCDSQILQHGIRSFCKNSGCRQGVYNGRTICNKQR